MYSRIIIQNINHNLLLIHWWATYAGQDHAPPWLEIEAIVVDDFNFKTSSYTRSIRLIVYDPATMRYLRPPPPTATPTSSSRNSFDRFAIRDMNGGIHISSDHFGYGLQITDLSAAEQERVAKILLWTTKKRGHYSGSNPNGAQPIANSRSDSTGSNAKIGWRRILGKFIPTSVSSSADDHNHHHHPHPHPNNNTSSNSNHKKVSDLHH